MRYCPECAALLTSRQIDGAEKKSCPSEQCGFVHWNNPVPVVAALVHYEGKILLARNVNWPEGVFSLVTGYLKRSETPEMAIEREVSEELGLKSFIERFIGWYSLSEQNQLVLAHSVLSRGDIQLSEEIAEVRLLSREELEAWDFGPLAMTSTIVRCWLNREVPTSEVW